MAAPAPECQDKRMRQKDKEERLAEALRENLRKRKAQARAVEQDVTPAKAGASGRKSGTEE